MAEYIDREAAVKAFNNFDAGRADAPPFTLLTPEEFAEYLYELPVADVAPVVHGTWVMIGADKRGRGGIWRCSACDRCQPYKSDYCPVCGAKNKSERVGGENGRRADNG